MTPCPRCGGPQILLLTSWACKAECDLKVHVDKPLTMIGQALQDQAKIAAKPSQRKVEIRVVDPWHYAPATGVTTVNLSLVIVDHAGNYPRQLSPVQDFTLVERDAGNYDVFLNENPAGQWVNHYLIVTYQGKGSMWFIR